MAVLSLRKTGGGADLDRLDAVTEDVAAGKRFLGAGSEETQEGTMPVQGSPSIVLLTGKYTGGKVSQQIATMGEQSVGPGAKQITINCAGKYMTGNIIIRPTKNLIISNIKKNQYVGGVGPGIWEGAGGDVWNQQKTFGLSGLTGNAYLYIGASSPLPALADMWSFDSETLPVPCRYVV